MDTPPPAVSEASDSDVVVGGGAETPPRRRGRPTGSVAKAVSTGVFVVWLLYDVSVSCGAELAALGAETGAVLPAAVAGGTFIIGAAVVAWRRAVRRLHGGARGLRCGRARCSGLGRSRLLGRPLPWRLRLDGGLFTARGVKRRCSQVRLQPRPSTAACPRCLASGPHCSSTTSACMCAYGTCLGHVVDVSWTCHRLG